MGSMTELRPIERLDQAKIDRVVAVVAPLTEQNSANKWAIGDALIAEWPVVQRADDQMSRARAARHQGEAGTVLPYLRVVARQVGLSVSALQRYRTVCNSYPPSDRVAAASFTAHRIVQHRDDRGQLLRAGMSCDALLDKIGRPTESVARRRRLQSFSNISKAAEAAIEILADDGIPADKRVQIAMSILVKFFEDAAVA